MCKVEKLIQAKVEEGNSEIMAMMLVASEVTDEEWLEWCDTWVGKGDQAAE